MKPYVLLSMIALGASVTGSVAWGQDANHIRLLASNCANCHGTDGKSQGGMPSLNGAAAAQTVKLMQEFKTGKRNATIMHQISKGYTDQEIEGLAAYFANIK